MNQNIISPEDAKRRLKKELWETKLPLKVWYRKKYTNSDHWKELRAAKIQSMGGKCEKCQETRCLQVHHLKYRDIFDVGFADLQVMCKWCHAEAHGQSWGPRENVRRVW